MKLAVSVLLLAVGGIFAWNNFPSLRTYANDTAESLKSWSPEDRKKQPVEYIEYAKGKLQDNIKKYEAALTEASSQHKTNREELEKYAAQEQLGLTATKEMKEIYGRTEAEGSWPVTYSGREYTRDGFREQVQRFLDERKHASGKVAQFQQLVDGHEAQRRQVQDRISELQRAISDLDAQKQQIKTAKLTEQSEAILTQLDEILDRSSEQVATDDILSLEDFAMSKAKAQAEEAKAKAETAADEELDDFLNS